MRRGICQNAYTVQCHSPIPMAMHFFQWAGPFQAFGNSYGFTSLSRITGNGGPSTFSSCHPLPPPNVFNLSNLSLRASASPLAARGPLTSLQLPLSPLPLSPHILTLCTFRSFFKPYVQTITAKRNDQAVTPMKPRSDSSIKFLRFIP